MLLPASFRGVSFAVTATDTSGGRRIALHQYPGRDTPWAEDMGRAARRFRLRGFVLDGDVILAGLPVELQRAILVQAIEKAGSGTLIHPTLGVLSVALERGSISEGVGANSYSEIELEFVESGKQTFPATSGLSSILSAASAALKVAGLAVTVISVARALTAGGSRAQASAAGSSWASFVKSAAVDATAMSRLAAELSGNYGRYSSGANSGISGSNASPYASSTTVAILVPIASANRQAAIEAADSFSDTIEAANLSDAPDIASAADDMIAALVAACADPADAIRLLISLLGHDVTGLTSDMATAINQAVMLAAAAALTEVTAAFQPQSADDAATRMAEIGDALYDLMTAAADVGQDECFAALRQCRGAVVTDLRNRGASLAKLRTFDFAVPTPALVLAQSVYTDASRADELVTQAGPIHPLFMPTSFQALAA